MAGDCLPARSCSTSSMQEDTGSAMAQRCSVGGLNSHHPIQSQSERSIIVSRRRHSLGLLDLVLVRDADSSAQIASGMPWEWDAGVAQRIIDGRATVTVLSQESLSPSAKGNRNETDDVKVGRVSSSPDRFHDLDTHGVHSTRMRQFIHAVCEERGPRSRMEDAYKVVRDLKSISTSPTVQYYAVFDGHSGTSASAYCRDNLHHNIVQHLNEQADWAAAMELGYLQTDHKFIELAQTNGEESGSAAISMIIEGSTLHIANAGDCRAVLSRRGVAVSLTNDHRPTAPEERRRVQTQGGSVEYDMVNGVLEVSRAIGDLDITLGRKTRGLTAHPDTFTRKLRDDDEFVILACDGLWDVFQSQEAVIFVRDLLAKDFTIEEICESLVEQALERECEDNVTVIVVAFPWVDNNGNHVQYLCDHIRKPTQRLRPKIRRSGMSKLSNLLN